LAIRLLKAAARSDEFQYAAGDLTEIYQSIGQENGLVSAQCWLWWEVMSSLPGFARNSLYWGVVMLKSYLKAAGRNILRQKGYSFINITGLAIGMACCMLLAVWILDELSYDRFFAGSERIMNIRAQQDGESTPNLLGPALQEKIPEIEYATRTDWMGQSLVTGKSDTSFQWVMAADPTFFKVFSYPFVSGNGATALDDVRSVVIAKDLADRFFHNENAVGQVLTLDNRREYVVTGVIENVPHNSTLQFDMLIPIESLIQSFRERDEDWASWGWWSAMTFVTIHTGCTVEGFNDKIRGFLQEQSPDDDNELFTVALSDLHFFSTGAKGYVYAFSMLALVVLIMACINFVNLSIARSARRAKETGIRKVAGAHRGNLISQYLGESVIMSAAASLLALGLLDFLLPFFNEMLSGHLTIDLLFDGPVIAILIGFTLITGIAAGTYPALYLSAFRPVAALKGNLGGGSGASRLRKSLVVVQFAASIILIIATTTVYTQVKYLKTKDIGYNKERIVNIALRGDSQRHYSSLKNDLLQHSNIQAVTACAAGLPYWRWTTGTVHWPGKDPNDDLHLAMNLVDYDFTKTFGIDLIEGRDFSRDFPSDSITSYLINEEMVKTMGLQSAEGAELTIWDNPGRVIGVMKNFHFRPLNSHIQPLAFVLNPEKVGQVSIRIAPGDISSTLGYIEQAWGRNVPGFPFDYTFLDQKFEASYRSIERIGNLAGAFAFLAIFIASLGLLGLASFTAEQRTKEIGIRKVLGASPTGVVRLLMREFVVLVTIANIGAWPLAWLAMNRWLEEFAYHIELGWSSFVMAGGLALAIAIVTVGSQTLKVARANPADSLKYE
jgi:ABC-type antimicrobial peptide transport system permease subunit